MLLTVLYFIFAVYAIEIFNCGAYADIFSAAAVFRTRLMCGYVCLTIRYTFGIIKSVKIS